MLIAGIGLTPCIVESSEYARSLWGAVPSPQSIAQKTTEFRQKAYELVGYKGVLGASLVILGALGLVWWKGLFGGVKKEADRRAEIVADFEKNMKKILIDMKKYNEKIYNNFTKNYIQRASLIAMFAEDNSAVKNSQIVEDHLTKKLPEDKELTEKVFYILTQLAIDYTVKYIYYPEFTSYLYDMIKLIVDMQRDLFGVGAG